MSEISEWFERRKTEWGQIEGFSGYDPQNRSKPFDPPKPLSQEELLKIEGEFGIALPDVYRCFLMEVGGCFSPSTSIRPLQRCQGCDKLRISTLYGSEAEGKYQLVEDIRVYKGRMPKQLIPIGTDGFGNQFCIGVDGEYRGRVYFWDHEDERDEEDYCSIFSVFGHRKSVPVKWLFGNVTLVANSFIDLLNGLEKES